MNNSKVNSSKGITFTGLLQIVFIVLKLCKVIDWSWVWILAPAWISVSIWLIWIAIILIFASRK